MKIYITPKMKIETLRNKDEILVMNPHMVEYSWGYDTVVDSGIEVGDVTIQGKEEKGKNESWDDLW